MLFVLLLLLPLPPLECNGREAGAPDMPRGLDISRMLLILPRLAWKPVEPLLLRRPRDIVLELSS